MNRLLHALRITSDRRPTPAAVVLLAGLLAALPATADESGGAKGANWTVFLVTGSKMAATEVHHDRNQGRYTLRLPNGGTIVLSDQAVRRVSRDTEDRVQPAAPVVAASTGSPRAGAAPGSLDTSSVRPKPLRQEAAAISPRGETLKDQAAQRLGSARSGLEGASPVVRRQSEEQLTPKRGRMESMIRRANREAAPARRR